MIGLVFAYLRGWLADLLFGKPDLKHLDRGPITQQRKDPPA